MYDVGTLEKDFTVFSHDFMKGKKKKGLQVIVTRYVSNVRKWINIEGGKCTKLQSKPKKTLSYFFKQGGNNFGEHVLNMFSVLHMYRV